MEMSEPTPSSPTAEGRAAAECGTSFAFKGLRTVRGAARRGGQAAKLRKPVAVREGIGISCMTRF